MIALSKLGTTDSRPTPSERRQIFRLKWPVSNAREFAQNEKYPREPEIDTVVGDAVPHLRRAHPRPGARQQHVTLARESTASASKSTRHREALTDSSSPPSPGRRHLHSSQFLAMMLSRAARPAMRAGMAAAAARYAPPVSQLFHAPCMALAASIASSIASSAD